jgi:hypothetical protein
VNRKALISTVVWATTIGGVVALLNGEQRAVSLRIWLAGFATWFAVATVRRLFQEVPVLPPRIRPLFRLRRKAIVSDNTRLRELRSLEGLLVRSCKNERAYAQQLRPRLLALAEHSLSVYHGIDLRQQTERAEAVLGDTAWIINPDPEGRLPTFDELDTFLQLLTTPSRSGAEEVA